MDRRVVVTGIGLTTSLGSDLPTFWNNIKEGKSGVSTIKNSDTSKLDVKIAAEIPDYDPLKHFDRKEVRKNDRFIQIAIVAARSAVKDAGLEIIDSNRKEIGVCIGSGIGGMITLEEQSRILFEHGPNRISPFFIPMMIPNMAAGRVAMDIGAQGPNLAVITACATGAHSIGESFEIIRSQRAKIMVAGGVEAAITPLAISGFNSMKALSTRNDDPKRASRPFDKDRDGFIMAEGAGVLIMEDYEHAINRGAKIYGEIVGFGMTGDAYHITMPHPEGEGAVTAMKMALACAKINIDDIDYLNAHGTSTPVGDIAETKAIKKVFGEKAKSKPISSTKSMTGHLLGAAGAVESIICIMAIRDSVIPPTINLDENDPECDLDYVPHTAREKNIKYAMNNSFGFGGQNAVLIIKKF